MTIKGTPRFRGTFYPLTGQRLEVLVAVVAAERVGIKATTRGLAALTCMTSSNVRNKLDELAGGGFIEGEVLLRPTSAGREAVAQMCEAQ